MEAENAAYFITRLEFTKFSVVYKHHVHLRIAALDALANLGLHISVSRSYDCVHVVD